MPKTKFQSVVFTAIMVFFMVFCMTAYTISLKTGGLSYRTFTLAVREMWLEYAIVFVLNFFAISKAAQRLAFRIVTPGQDKPIFIIIAIQVFTVCLTVPTITLIAALIHNGFTADWFTNWVNLAVACFPMALCLQLFFVGPLVRWIFRTIFARQLTAVTEPHVAAPKASSSAII